MFLKMKSTYASPIRIVHSGDLFDFDATESKALLEGKFAEQATKQEIEAWRTKQAKNREREKNRDA